MNRALAFVVVCLFVGQVSGEEPLKPGFHLRSFVPKTGEPAKYTLFVPFDKSQGEHPPIILFLHGSGQTGSDGEGPAKTALGKYIRAHEKSFPFVVVFPQSQKRTWQAKSVDGQRAMDILAECEKLCHTDPKRVYLTGLSMGGYGTWSFAATHPNRWAAMIPICGGGDPASAAKIKGIPCWCFHGDADTSVPVEKSRAMIAALKAAGATPKYDEYAGVGHNSWDRAYATDGLYDWLLAHKLK